MQVQRKEYAIGTTKRVAVLRRDVVTHKDRRKLERPYEVLTVEELKTVGPKEAWILAGSGWHPDAVKGDTGIITYSIGGTRGPYWLFIPDKKRPA